MLKVYAVKEFEYGYEDNAKTIVLLSSRKKAINYITANCSHSCFEANNKDYWKSKHFYTEPTKQNILSLAWSIPKTRNCLKIETLNIE